MRWLIFLGVVLSIVAAMLAMSSRCNKHTVVITEIGFLIFFGASLIPPITSETSDLYEAFAIIICFILLAAIFGYFEHHEWVFDIISAFMFGVAVQLYLVGTPVEQVIQVVGMAVVTAGIARGVGLHATPAGG